jgi:hypothetical protein
VLPHGWHSEVRSPCAGCKDMTTSARRQNTGGITVIFEVQAGEIPVANLESALSSDTFSSSFESNMAANGYTVSATLVKEKTESSAFVEEEKTERQLSGSRASAPYGYSAMLTSIFTVSTFLSSGSY